MLLVVPDSVLIVTASAETVIWVSTAPACSVTLTEATEAVSTFTPSTNSFLNPLASTKTVYVTGSRSWTEKVPALDVVMRLASLVPTLVTMTEAFTMIAPV